MLGRGLVSRPDLARQVVAAAQGIELPAMTWAEFMPLLQDFWLQAAAQLTPRAAPGRLKQWLAMLTRTYPEAVLLFDALRRETELPVIDRLLDVQRSAAA
jgi:tRNA-dihydrouridine synthase C